MGNIVSSAQSWNPAAFGLAFGRSNHVLYICAPCFEYTQMAEFVWRLLSRSRSGDSSFVSKRIIGGCRWPQLRWPRSVGGLWAARSQRLTCNPSPVIYFGNPLWDSVTKCGKKSLPRSHIRIHSDHL